MSQDNMLTWFQWMTDLESDDINVHKAFIAQQLDDTSIAKEALRYMADKSNWKVEKHTGWMVMARPRDTYIPGQISCNLEPWVFAADTLAVMGA